MASRSSPHPQGAPLRPWLEHHPDLDRLTAQLEAALRESGRADAVVTVLERRRTAYASSSPSEIVTCRVGPEPGPALELYCKYGARHGREDYAHRGDRRYEAAVYRDVLRPLGRSTPAYYGSVSDEPTGDTLLVVEYLGPCPRVNETAEPEAMPLAARWIGEFHAALAGRAPNAFLRAYGAPYYRGWAERTLRFAEPLLADYPWLARACTRFGELAPSLVAPPQDVIHGEYYPHNVLFRAGCVHPIDWESAAVGPGEIDLASLTDRWPSEIREACEREYRRARWPEGAPAELGVRLDLARLYLQWRWLGDRAEWTLAGRMRWRFEELRRLADERGWL